MYRIYIVLWLSMLCLLLPSSAVAQVPEPADTTSMEVALQNAVVKAQRSSKPRFKTENTELILSSQLIRAACCNLGESFTTNPSVDVSYSDAATGARQIKLLGLSGTYVQMLTENVPNLRGASLPYALGFVPGPWMQSIQVSKGASSVKNGYESTTGQINIEYLKPQGKDGVRANAYLDSHLKQEVNADGSVHINDRLSTSLLLHFENRQMEHDGNGDGFMDMPKVRQYNVMHRWAYVSPQWISQLSLHVLRDKRQGGQISADNRQQTTDGGGELSTLNPQLSTYTTFTTINRYQAQWKNGFTLNADHNTSIALMLQGAWHDAWNGFGLTRYDVTQKTGYAQLMFETDFTPQHNLSVGASLNHDDYSERYCDGSEDNRQQTTDGGGKLSTVNCQLSTRETTPGLYAQYTYKLGDRLTVMPGLRWDYSTRYGGFFTPRLHIKYSPIDALTLRASAGKGYRSPHALAENTPLLATGRTIIVADDLKQEEAWNTGLAASLNLPVGGKPLEVNAEYYYTHFINQMVINYDGAQGPHTLSFENLAGKSYSHTFQIDATYPFFSGFTATAAFRLNDVKCTYRRAADGGQQMADNRQQTTDGYQLSTVNCQLSTVNCQLSTVQRPLTSRYKGLLTLSYKTPLELWQFDLTGQLNGDGTLYDGTRYPAYFQLQAQVTREFRYFSLYLGGENLTHYRISEPIIHAHHPWSPQFDATQVWGPTMGAMAYIGVRFKMEKF